MPILNEPEHENMCAFLGSILDDFPNEIYFERCGSMIELQLNPFVTSPTAVSNRSSKTRSKAIMSERNEHELLDEFKLRLSEAVLARADLPTIRAKSLSNLQRWQDKGTWGPVYDEWRGLMLSGSDAEIIAVMTGLDQEANRLRQSPPYTGTVDEETRERFWTQYLVDYEAEFDGHQES
jgi:hypothetical protein